MAWTLEKKPCRNCGILFERAVWRKSIYCSRTCQSRIPWNKGKTGLVTMTDQTRKKMSESGKRNKFTRYLLKGERHPQWKGENIDYRGLHKWVTYYLGKPEKCEHCGVDKKPSNYKRYFEWANKSHEYKRELTDWIRLCKPCHAKYDVEHRQGELNFGK